MLFSKIISKNQSILHRTTPFLFAFICLKEWICFLGKFGYNFKNNQYEKNSHITALNDYDSDVCY
jgi:hypothetical protein